MPLQAFNGFCIVFGIRTKDGIFRTLQRVHFQFCTELACILPQKFVCLIFIKKNPYIRQAVIGIDYLYLELGV